MKVFYELYELGLTVNQVTILSYFIGFKGKPCKTVNKTLAKKFNLHINTVQKTVKSLVDMKLIQERWEKGKKSIIFDQEQYSAYRKNWLIEDAKKKARQEKAEREKNAPSEN